MVTIIGMRHPQKDGDEITAYGAMQTFAACKQLTTCKQLKKEGMHLSFRINRLIYSGANRTWETALVAKAAVGCRLQLEENTNFHYNAPFNEAYGDEKDPMAVFLVENQAIKNAGGTVATALDIGYGARISREYIVKAITDLAQNMDSREEEVALILTHSPLIELAVPEDAEKSIPYHIGEADSIVY